MIRLFEYVSRYLPNDPCPMDDLFEPVCTDKACDLGYMATDPGTGMPGSPQNNVITEYPAGGIYAP